MSSMPAHEFIVAPRRIRGHVTCGMGVKQALETPSKLQETHSYHINYRLSQNIMSANTLPSSSIYVANWLLLKLAYPSTPSCPNTFIPSIRLASRLCLIALGFYKNLNHRPTFNTQNTQCNCSQRSLPIVSIYTYTVY